MVGIVEKGDYDILIGNDVSRELELNIDVSNRSFTYAHPTLGV